MKTNPWVRIGAATAILTVVAAGVSACIISYEKEAPSSGNTPTINEQKPISFSPKATEVVTDTPTTKPTEAVTTTATEVAFVGTVLSNSEMSELDLVGDANRLNVNYEGVPVSVILAVSPRALNNYFDNHGLTLDESVKSIGVDPETNLAEFVLMGHYRGYMEDHGLNSSNYSFERYIQDMKGGKDLSYLIWGTNKNTGKLESIKINPRNGVQVVFTGFTSDLDGDSNVRLGQNSACDYYLEKNGDLRITLFYPRGKQIILDYIANSSSGFTSALSVLGVSEAEQRIDRSNIIMREWDPLTWEMSSLIVPSKNNKGYPIIKER